MPIQKFSNALKMIEEKNDNNLLDVQLNCSVCLATFE